MNGIKHDRLLRYPIRGNREDDPANMAMWITLSFTLEYVLEGKVIKTTKNLSGTNPRMFRESPKYIGKNGIGNGKYDVMNGKWDGNRRYGFEDDYYEELDDINLS